MNTQSTCVYSVLYLLFVSWLNADPIVTISQGLLNGTKFESKKGRHFSAFIGIPFAQPPIGPLRFSSPAPGKPWDGIRSANKEANMCPQLSTNGNVLGDEDCLYLNVYTPVLNFAINSTRLPVMVWIHGGGFFMGSGGPSQFGPNYLLDKDIVLVSLNYRLGILGFFTTGDSVAPGNFGLKDQVLALKWVQKNIQFFGGDPNRVTIFGASAGGASVNFHALSDASNGLFHQYIIQSGSVLAPWAYRNRSHFKPFAKKAAENVGCLIINSNDLVKCLREKTVDKLLNSSKYENFDYPILHWIPTDESESEEAFLTDSPKKLIEQNKMKDYPLMSGNVVDEGILVTLPFYANTTTESMRDAVEKCITLTASHYVTEDIPKFREMVKDFYFNESIISSKEDELLENYTKFISDSGFLYPQIILADKLAKRDKHPVYFYLFGYSGNANLLTFTNNIQKTFGVPHGDEILYLFPILPPSFLSKKDESVVHLMVDLWTSFAINGNPTSDLLTDSNIWLPYNRNNSFLQIGNITNHFEPSATLQYNFFSDRINFWKTHFPII